MTLPVAGFDALPADSASYSVTAGALPVTTTEALQASVFSIRSPVVPRRRKAKGPILMIDPSACFLWCPHAESNHDLMITNQQKRRFFTLNGVPDIQR
ncbi:MAG: hypothetical protein V5B33_19880 [Candidatus Accumulibacter sp. UW20]|jgi:hypothetical protein